MDRGYFLILTRKEIEQLISLEVAISVVEEAFRDFAKGESFLFPVIRQKIDPYEGFFGVKAGFMSTRAYVGYKGGGFWSRNLEKGIAAHQSLIVIYDATNGIPLAALDGNYLTVIRTGAVGAIAAKFLARKDSEKVAIIGGGTQGRIQLEALLHVLPIKEARCYDVCPEVAKQFATLWKHSDIKVDACLTPHEAVMTADVIVTTTPSFKPIVMNSWIAPGMHINAIGADTKGKQEIDEGIFARAKVVVDSFNQARELGETQHAIHDGIIESVHAELGEIITGTKSGRVNDSEITLFDATGIAIQDLSVAAYAYEAAISKGIGTRIQMDN